MVGARGFDAPTSTPPEECKVRYWLVPVGTGDFFHPIDLPVPTSTIQYGHKSATLRLLTVRYLTDSKLRFVSRRLLSKLGGVRMNICETQVKLGTTVHNELSITRLIYHS